MRTQLLSFFVVSTGLNLCLLKNSVHAQVTSDGTLSTTVTQSSSDFTIDQGNRVGNNLFHSFRQFSVPTGGAAIFNNAVDVQNIFSRVTGGNVSHIDGVIRANGSANLFLLNPRGILFGPNASLNIGGSFIGTTATSIKFADGVEFSAANASEPPLLTVNLPVGLQIGQMPGAIQVTDSGHQVAVVGSGLLPLDRSKTPPGLQVSPGKTLALIGGGVSLAGGILQAPGGHIELGSVRAGAVNLAAMNQGWGFDYALTTQFQDIQLSQQSLVDVSGDGGSIQLRGQNILFSDWSAAIIQHIGSQRGGDIVLNAADSIEFSQSQPNSFTTRIETQTLGTGSSGDVQVTAQRLRLQNGAHINTASYAVGGSGVIRVNVAESIDLLGAFPGDLSTDVSRIASSSFRGNGGEILIDTKQLSLQDGASVSSVAFGRNSSSGNVIINATDFIQISGVKPNILSSTVSSSTFSNGNGATLMVNTPRLRLQDGGRISSSTFASGNAGNVVVTVSENLEISGIGPDRFQNPSAIAASALSPQPVFQRALGLPSVPTGNAGSVTINTPQLSISNGSQVGVNNVGMGNAGNLTIAADRLFLSTRGKITASTASGEGGDIALNLGEILSLRSGSQIDTQAAGRGNGGNITINAPVIGGFENSDIVANAVQGQGGNIQINTQGIFGLQFRPRLSPENDITASSQFGVTGSVQVNTIGIDPNAGLIQLPVNLTDTSRQIVAGCAEHSDNRFVITGRGGIPENPMEVVKHDRPWSDVRDPIAFRSPIPPLPIVPSPRPVTEATTWQRNPDGGVELVASPSRPPSLSAPVTCAGRMSPS